MDGARSPSEERTRKMKTRPILFSAEMVRALLEGRKTQTRRIMEIQPIWNDAKISTIVSSTKKKENGKHRWLVMKDQCTVNNDRTSDSFPNPYGEIGDLLWVRESCGTGGYFPHPWAYRADGKEYPGERWKPSIHMPRRASRLTLEITGVRVERLQDMRLQDYEAEGIVGINESISAEEALQRFQALWQSLYGAESWHASPWVWVIEFKVHKVNVDELMKGRA